jgi:hypothetical protein
MLPTEQQLLDEIRKEMDRIEVQKTDTQDEQL